MKTVTRKVIYVLVCLSVFLTGCNRSHRTAHGYIEGKYTYIAPQTTGILNDIAVSRGDPVQKGQLLFTIDPEPQISEVNQAKARFKQAQANLANLEKGMRPSEIAALEAQKQQILAKLMYAQKTMERYQQLVKKKVLDQSKLDQATADYKALKAQLTEITEHLKTAQLKGRVDEIAAAKAEVEAAKAALEKADWKLSQKKSYAQIDGIVFDIYYRRGELIPLDRPVLSVLAPENVYVVFFVSEKTLESIQLKQKILIDCDRCPSAVDAMVSFISPEAEFTPPVIYSEKTRVNLVYRIEAAFSHEDTKKMHPGQPVTVMFKNAVTNG